jgi:hypothetical protein
MVGGSVGGSGRWTSAAVAFAAGILAACTMNRPVAETTRPGPEASTVSGVPRDTLFARALAAVRAQGFTEISPDPAAGQVRAKSRDGMQIRITLSPTGDSTQVRITTEGDPRGPGMDSQAMATVLALASAISAPNGARRDSTLARPDSARP